MCGIAGILRVTPASSSPEALRHALTRPHAEAIPEAWLDTLDASIKHRGPDGQGRFRDRAVRHDGSVVDVAFVHRRLSILDHAGGAQPMVSIGDATVRSRSVGDATVRERSSPEVPGLPAALVFHGRPGDPVRYTPLAEPALTPPDGRVSDVLAVVFNGCIYNHRELRTELTNMGYRFVSDHSDTEVLLHAWDAARSVGSTDFPRPLSFWNGLPCRLNGMYAFATWDRYSAGVHLYRDPAGQKPLYYASASSTNDALFHVFGSSVPGVIGLAHTICPDPWLWQEAGLRKRIAELRDQGVAPGLQVQSVDAGMHPTLGVPHTVFDVRSFELATLEAQLTRPSPTGGAFQSDVRTWVRFGFGRKPPFVLVHEVPANGYAVLCGYDDIFVSAGGNALDNRRRTRGYVSPPPLDVDRADRLLRAAVTRHLTADVSIACALSGGVDSSVVAAFAHDALKQQGQRLRTFCVAMPDTRLDESAFAQRVASHLGTDHTTLACGGEAAHDLVGLIRQLGLPLGDSSLLPTHWVARAMRDHAPVALGGDGGDEVFGGYARHIAAGWLRKARFMRWLAPLARRLGGDYYSKRSRAERFLRAAGPRGYEELLALFSEAQQSQLQVGARPTTPENYGVDLQRPWLADYAFYLPYDLMRKSDTASMAVALEVRSPMLDLELLDAAQITPREAILLNGQRKGLLRAVARRYLPADIVDRPKQGFAIPIGEWYRSDFGGMKTLLMDHLHSVEPFGPPRLGIELNQRFIEQMLTEHMDNRRDHGQRLYMLLVLSIWAKWVGGQG